MEEGEDLEAGACRELKEEKGLGIEVLHQLRAFGAPNRDPRGHTVTIVHYNIITGKPPKVEDSDDADARWFAVNELPQVGFDQPQIVNTALEQVQKKWEPSCKANSQS